MARPFEGIRGIDLTHVLAGPFATYQLALPAMQLLVPGSRKDSTFIPESAQMSKRGIVRAPNLNVGRSREIASPLTGPEN
jgi:hypothetical protein